MVQWFSTFCMVQMVVNTHRHHGAVVQYILHSSDGWLFHIQTAGHSGPVQWSSTVVQYSGPVHCMIQTAGHSGPVQWSNTLHDSESWSLQTHTEQDAVIQHTLHVSDGWLLHTHTHSRMQ